MTYYISPNHMIMPVCENLVISYQDVMHRLENSKYVQTINYYVIELFELYYKEIVLFIVLFVLLLLGNQYLQLKTEIKNVNKELKTLKNEYDALRSWINITNVKCTNIFRDIDNLRDTNIYLEKKVKKLQNKYR